MRNMDVLHTLYIKTHCYCIGLAYHTLLLWFPTSQCSPYLIVPISFIFLIPSQAEEINS